MNNESFRLLAVALLVGFSLQGCATVSTISEAKAGSPKVFSGTRLDVHALTDNRAALSRFPVDAPRYPLLDLPFSVTLDILLLPLTVPVATSELVFD